MDIDVTSLTNAQLKALIQNHRRKKATRKPRKTCHCERSEAIQVSQVIVGTGLPHPLRGFAMTICRVIRGVRTDLPLFLEALREQEKRTGDFEKSLSIIRRAARDGKFLSYKELADASGADWGQVHYAIGGHLWKLVEYAYRKGWPMLSAIVVNKPNVADGTMEPETLKGFISAAYEFGLIHGEFNGEVFLRKQQAKVFAWGQGEPLSPDEASQQS